MKKENPTREGLINEFLTCLEQEKLPWRSGWKCTQNINGKTNTPYQGINQMYLSFVAYKQGYKDNRWMTYNQAKAMGYQVKRGSKGVKLEKWGLYDKTNKRQVNIPKEMYLKKFPDAELRMYSTPFVVFNAEQIANVPELQSSEISISEKARFVDNLKTNLGIKYEEHGNEAYYIPSDDKVVLPPVSSFESEYAYLSTKLHEFSHSCCSTNRLGFRNELTGDNREKYAKEELMVEMASAFLCQSIGLDMPDLEVDNHKAYLQSWASILKEDPDILFTLIKKAEKIEKYEKEIGEFDKYITEESEIEIEEDLERTETEEYGKPNNEKVLVLPQYA